MTFEAPIFIPNTRKRYDLLSVIVYSLFGGALVGCLIKPFNWLTPHFIVIGVLFLIFKYSNNTRYEPLNGIINGTMKISDNTIMFDERRINLDEIVSVDFQSSKYYGERKHSDTSGVYSPNLSQGVKNYIKITTDKGEEITTWFRLTDKEHAQQLRELVKWFTVKGKIPLLHTISLLQLPYKEVQELKAEMAVGET